MLSMVKFALGNMFGLMAVIKAGYYTYKSNKGVLLRSTAKSKKGDR